MAPIPGEDICPTIFPNKKCSKNAKARKETVEAGDGITFPKPGDRLKMHYTGTLAEGGKQFDSSRDRGSLFEVTIGVGQVIKGWDEGMVKMRSW